MKLLPFLLLPVLFSTTSVTDLVSPDYTKASTVWNSASFSPSEVVPPWKTSEHQPVTLSVLVWYLGPHNGYVKELVNSTHLPSPGYNISAGVVHTSLPVYPTFSPLKTYYGGSSANSISPVPCL